MTSLPIYSPFNLLRPLYSSFFHASIPTLAFGGVGESGQGSYRGKASFDAFTHRRSVTTTPNWMEFLLSVRYPPYKGKLAKFQNMANLKPNFDRNGNVKQGLVSWILSLGAKDSKGGLIRYIIVLIGEYITYSLWKFANGREAAVGMKQYLDHTSKL